MKPENRTSPSDGEYLEVLFQGKLHVRFGAPAGEASFKELHNKMNETDWGKGERAHHVKCVGKRWIHAVAVDEIVRSSSHME